MILISVDVGEDQYR